MARARDRSALRNLAVGQSARTVDRTAIAVELRAFFEDIVRAPHFPHALREVRVEVAVEDRVARGLVAVARAAVRDLGSKRVARSHCLAIEIARVVAVRRIQPLVRVQVVDVVLFRTCMDHPHLHVVVEIAVVNV